MVSGPLEAIDVQPDEEAGEAVHSDMALAKRRVEPRVRCGIEEPLTIRTAELARPDQ